MRILYTQPIFLPDTEILEKNIQSIKSLKNLLNKSDDIDIDIELGGWSINDEYWNIFITRLNSLKLKNMTVHRFDKNYGKAYVINKLTTNIKEYDFMLTADSDIIFKDTDNFINRLIYIAAESEKYTNKPFGFMGINQEISNCHQIEYLSQNKHDFNGFSDNYETIIWNDAPSGIAGGCLFISSENWLEIGGYKELGVYAGDDAMLIIDTKNINYSYFLTESICVIHPPENNNKYQEWKIMVCQRDSHGNSSGVDVDKINEAQNFWK